MHNVAVNKVKTRAPSAGCIVAITSIIAVIITIVINDSFWGIGLLILVLCTIISCHSCLVMLSYGDLIAAKWQAPICYGQSNCIIQKNSGVFNEVNGNSGFLTHDNLKSEEAPKRLECVTFGRYEQSINLNNQKEPIQWLILEKDDKTALLISKYALDCKPYNTTNADITWENSTLRRWLNSDFYNTAFSTEEKSRIILSDVSADTNPNYDTNPGSTTKDKVYLLSIRELAKYSNSDVFNICAPTKYAVAQGAYTDPDYMTSDRLASGWWWLRSPGYAQDHAVFVYYNGLMNCDGLSIDYNFNSIRPVVRVLQPIVKQSDSH